MPTKIEWCDEVWNPITGCTPVSEGCENCYAKRMSYRLKGRFGYPGDEPFRVTYHPERIEQPMRWKKHKRIFVCSMGDLFHPDVNSYRIMDVLSMVELCQQHTFIFLTKRPERMKVEITEHFKWMDRAGGEGTYFKKLNNLWLGVSVENQCAADERIPILLETPAAVRFVSVEPMLDEIDLTRINYDNMVMINSLEGLCGVPIPHSPDHCPSKLDWVICGGETGPGAREAKPEWIRKVYEQCKLAQVPCFFKQWGDFKGERDLITFSQSIFEEIENCKEVPKK